MRALPLIVIVLLGGCATARYSPAVFHWGRLAGCEVRTVPAAGLAFQAALEELWKHPGCTVTYISGESRSMAPHWTGPAFGILDQGASYAHIELGNLIVFRRQDGRNIIHTVVAKDRAGLITAGTANDRSDYGRVTRANFIGVIRVVFAAEDAK